MNVMQRKKRPTLVDRVTEHVFHGIISGRYAPGSKVTEEGLAEELDVSRTPVREAVKRLSDLGLIIVRPRSGLVVAAVDEQDVHEIRVLRESLETLAVRLALPRLGPEQIAQLETIQARCEKLLEEGAERLSVFRQDSRLHLALAAMSGNRHLEEMLRRLDVKVMLCRMYMCSSTEKIRHDVLYHRRIIAALADGDPGSAVECMRDHVRGVSVQQETQA